MKNVPRSVLTYLDNLSSDDQARLSGYVMNMAGVNLEAMKFFVSELDENNKSELEGQIDQWSEWFEEIEVEDNEEDSE